MRIVITFTAILLAGTFCFAQETSPKPNQQAYFYIGGFNGPTYHVNIRDGRLLYRQGVGFNQANIEWTERALKKGEFAMK